MIVSQALQVLASTLGSRGSLLLETNHLGGQDDVVGRILFDLQLDLVALDGLELLVQANVVVEQDLRFAGRDVEGRLCGKGIAEEGNVGMVEADAAGECGPKLIGAPFAEARSQIISRVVGTLGHAGRVERARWVSPGRPQPGAPKLWQSGFLAVVVNVSDEGEGQVAAGAITRNDNLAGRDVEVVEQVVVGRDGILESGGELAARVGGQAVLGREDVRRGRVGKEGVCGEAHFARAAGANGKGAAVEVHHDVARLAGPGGRGRIPRAADLLCLGLTVLRGDAGVALSRGWADADPALLLLVGRDGERRLDGDNGGVPQPGADDAD